MEFRFIDTHVHFWDPDTFEYSWLASLPSINRAHTPEELRDEAGDAFPEQLVFVECGAPALAEVECIETLAGDEPCIAAIVAFCQMDAGAATKEAIAALAARPLVKGVRHNFQGEPDPAFCLRPDFVKGARRLGPAGLSFDLCCFHHQLASAVELVRRCPDTFFILDHFGKPAIRDGQLDPWRENLASLAGLPNVACKLSGLVTEADWTRWTVDHLRPYVDHALEVFGPQRMLFGGDWPVAKLAASYPRWLQTARDLVSHLAPDEQATIFYDNARRIYRLR